MGLFLLVAATLVISVVSTVATLYFTHRWTERDDDVSKDTSGESQLSTAHSDVSASMFRSGTVRHDLPPGVAADSRVACNLDGVNQTFRFDL